MYWLAHIGYSFLLAELVAFLVSKYHAKKNPSVEMQDYHLAWGLKQFSFYGILIGALGPDLIDKGISMQIVGYGRYIGHSLFFGAVIILCIYFIFRKKPRVWMGFTLGWVMHIILDSGGFLPLFFPLIHYDFEVTTIDFLERLLTYPEIYVNEIVGSIFIITLIAIYIHRHLSFKLLLLKDVVELKSSR